MRKEDGTLDPRGLSGYKLKELIWTDWRNEWEARPAAPGSIRLIIWGKMIDDKKTLSGKGDIMLGVYICFVLESSIC